MLFRKNGANPFTSDRQDQKERIKRQSLSKHGLAVVAVEVFDVSLYGVLHLGDQ